MTKFIFSACSHSAAPRRPSRYLKLKKALLDSRIMANPTKFYRDVNDGLEYQYCYTNPLIVLDDGTIREYKEKEEKGKLTFKKEVEKVVDHLRAKAITVEHAVNWVEGLQDMFNHENDAFWDYDYD